MMQSLTDSEITALRGHVARQGMPNVYRAVGVTMATVTRAIAGMRLHAGTATQIRMFLAADKNEKAAVAAATLSHSTFSRPEIDSKTCSYPAR